MIYEGFNPDYSARIDNLKLERDRHKSAVISIRKFFSVCFFLALAIALIRSNNGSYEERYGGQFFADIITWTFILTILSYAAYFGISIKNKSYYLRRRTDEEIIEQVRKEKDEDPHGLWGRGVMWFNTELYNDNSARPKDIVDALKSKYPLEIGENHSPEEIAVLNKRMKSYHFDGHLCIGGMLYTDTKGHILTVGSSRVGQKGTCLIIPALLGIPNRFPNAPSYIVLDPKGENLAVTGHYLQESGYDVICINPFNIPEIYLFGNGGFNVFDTFDANTPNFDDYADMVSSALVVSTPNSNTHFDQTSRSYISLYIRHLMTQDEEPKNFRTLYKWLQLAGETRLNFLSNMMLNPAFDKDIANEAEAIKEQILSGANREVESTYSTIRAKIEIFKNQQLRDSISDSTFDITQVAQKKTAIFVCMNPTEMEKNQAWLRILFGSFIRSLSRNYNKDRKVVMILDEFATMGRFNEVQKMMAFMAGYNVTLWPIVQDLTQLKDIYRDGWESFVGNSVVRHFTSIGDNFTADYVSKRMPIVDKGSKEKPLREPLYRPDEVQSSEYIITFIAGVSKPAFLLKYPYYRDGTIGGSASPNPFFKP